MWRMAHGTISYSNTGYIVAGAMLEAVSGQDWETLVTQLVFQPLGMIDSGFGAPGTIGFVDQPQGHRRELGSWVPYPPSSPEAENPLIVGPAGTVHVTLADYAEYMVEHIAGAEGAGLLLTADTYAALHTPPTGGDYAAGWAVVTRDWARGQQRQVECRGVAGTGTRAGVIRGGQRPVPRRREAGRRRRCNAVKALRGLRQDGLTTWPG
jgi:CubicO group peptidase (beta-lactamase class C family)